MLIIKLKQNQQALSSLFTFHSDFNKRLGSAGPAALGGRPRSLESPDVSSNEQVIDAMNILDEDRTGRNTVDAGILN